MIKDLVEGAKQNPIWFGAIGVAVSVQGWLGWRFWGSLAEDPIESAALRALGVGLVGAEVVALDMASRAWLRDDRVRAGVLGVMWFWFAGLNLGADANSFTRVLEARDTSRAIILTEQTTDAAQRKRIADDILKAEQAYRDPLLTIGAYDAKLVAKDREIALASSAPNWRQRQLERERGEILARRAAVAEINGKKETLAALERAAAEVAPPNPEAAEFQPLADAIGLLPFADKPKAEDVRAGAAILGILAMKLLLTLGIWAGLERSRLPNRRPSRSKDDGKADAPTSLPDQAADETPPAENALPVRAGNVTPLRPRAPVQRFGRNGRSR